MFKRKVLAVFTAAVMVCSFGGGGISALHENTSSTYVSAAQSEFNEFLDEFFLGYVSGNTINLHFTLKNPEAYGIEPFEPSLGVYSRDAFMGYKAYLEELSAALGRFNYAALTDEQRLTYDILKYYIDIELKLLAGDYIYYSNYLKPDSGFHAQFPVLLAEYAFYDEGDVKDYLGLLTVVEPYFQGLLAFEKEKSAKGLFMSDSTADAVIKQCKDFAALKENNYLIDTFNTKIDGMKLSDGQKAAYKKDNREKVLQNIIPAYTKLANGLTALKGTGRNQGGLVGFKNGDKYYELLVRQITGSDKSVKQIAKMIDDENERLISDMLGIAVRTNFGALDYIDYDLDFGYDDPDEILEVLRGSITDSYPPAAKVGYTLNYVHPSLEDALAPAFYFSPPIDDYASNSIYINKGGGGAGPLMPTLAHEGYPGHLYQITYFTAKNVHPVRKTLNFGGYTEGWAIYAELDSYRYASYPDVPANMKNDVIALWRINTELNLSIQSRVDIGVNYEGWSIKDVERYLDDFGMGDAETAKLVYDYVVQDPAKTLMYYVGYLEIRNLRIYAQRELGGDFSLKDFNKCILDVGPAPFSIVKNEVEKYVASAYRKSPLINTPESILEIILNALSAA